MVVLRPGKQVAVCRQMGRRWSWGIPGKGSSMYEVQRHKRASCVQRSMNILHGGRQGSNLAEEKARVSSEEKGRARVKGMHD